MDADILPPSDDRVFKLILTSPESKAGLMRLISAVIGHRVVDVALFPNELGLAIQRKRPNGSMSTAKLTINLR